MKAEPLDLAYSLKRDGRPPQPQRVPTAREVLEELFQLLEDYAPTWYTEEHHNRAVAALQGKEVNEPPEEHTE